MNAVAAGLRTRQDPSTTAGAGNKGKKKERRAVVQLQGFTKNGGGVFQARGQDDKIYSLSPHQQGRMERGNFPSGKDVIFVCEVDGDNVVTLITSTISTVARPFEHDFGKAKPQLRPSSGNGRFTTFTRC